jgi:hypothetical protein
VPPLPEVVILPTVPVVVPPLSERVRTTPMLPPLPVLLLVRVASPPDSKAGPWIEATFASGSRLHLAR